MLLLILFLFCLFCWQKWSSNLCMHKYKPVEFQFDPKVERTARRLRKEQQNLKAAVIMDDSQDIGNLNSRGEMQLVNAQGGQKGQNGHIIYEQPGNNNIIHMTDDRNRASWDYAVVTSQAINLEIVSLKVQVDNFELKLVMFQMLQIIGQFNGLPYKDPHIHLKLFLQVSDTFNIVGAL